MKTKEKSLLIMYKIVMIYLFSLKIEDTILYDNSNESK